MTTTTVRHRRVLFGLGGAGFALLAAGPACAGAFYLQEQSVKAAGRAFSGEVADTGAESLWWNPAAIGGVASSAYLGASGIFPSGDVTDRGTAIVHVNPATGGPAPGPVGGNPNAHNPINNGVLPAGGFGLRLSDQLSVGVVVTSPFSFTTNYDADSWARYEADKTRLRTIDVQPTIAFAPVPWLSVGAGLNIEHAKATLSNKLANVFAGEPDGEDVLKGHGWDFGWSAGAQLRAMDGRLTVGASYKSSVKHDLSGDVTISGLLPPIPAANNLTAGTHANFRTPWQAMVGARFKLTPAFTLNAQVVRLGWNKFDAIRIAAPLDQQITEDYRNTWSIAGGVDYEVTPNWTLRAGIQHDQSPTRNGERDPRVPDSNRMNYAAGTSFKLGHGVTIDASVSYIDFKNASIDRPDETPFGTPILVDGELHGAHAWTGGLGARLSF